MSVGTVSLAGALGRTLAGVDGLSYFHVPNGLDIGHAAEIVKSANRARSSASAPFAILINAAGAEKPLAEHDVVVVTAKESVRYRQGDRLAVVFGRQPDLASFLQTFSEVGGPSYPDAASHRIGLAAVSRLLVEDLMALSDSGEIPSAEASNTLNTCLESLRDLHTVDQQGVGSWNVRWFRHVEAGLQNLVTRFRALVDSASILDLDEFMQQWCSACFGLPRQEGPAKKGSAGLAAARELAEAFHEYWSDEDSLKQSLIQIAGRRNDPSLAATSVSGFNDAVLESGDPKSGLVEWIEGDPGRVETLARIPVADFVDPSGTAKDVFLRMELVGGGSLILDSDTPAAPCVVPLITNPSEGRQPRSPEIDVLVPWSGPPQPVVGSDLCTLNVVPKGAGVWETATITTEPGQLRIRGRFHRPAGTGRNAAHFRSASVTLGVDRSQALSVFLPSKPGHRAYFLSSDEPLLVVAPLRGDGSHGRPTVLEPSDDDDLDPVAEIVPSSGGYRALVWHPDGAELVALNGNAIGQHISLPQVHVAHFTATAESDFTVGDLTFRIRPVAAGKGQQSALIAAALKEQVRSDRPKTETENSIRGAYESVLGRAFSSSNPAFRQALGHVAMLSTHSGSLEEVQPQWNGAVLMSNSGQKLLHSHMMPGSFEDEFVSGPEAARFRDALDSLELGKILGRRGTATTLDFEWPSRTSFKQLWEDGRLDNYLNSYADLVAAAMDSSNEVMRFWAAYPFSVTVWEIADGYHCSAVLLSPIHPLRLAWLAGSESVLAEAQRASDLLGGLEGWNFPIVGPGPRKTRRMIAVPSDAGEDQIFLGWSTLVPAGSDEGRPLKSPARIGDYMAPGTAATGLNGTSVDAALRSFRRMHPHSTTLTVDLAASQSANRVGEIDSAVLSMAQEWSSLDSFQGGIRVFDSVNREGTPPRDDVTEMVRENSELLVTWSRYRPDLERPISCNIRFLEGAGITARVGSQGLTKGAIAPVPLRRFEAHGQTIGAFENPAYPGIAGAGVPSPFVRALQQVEGGSPAIHSGMLPTFVSDGSADWTVLGETHVTPAVMAGIMDHHSNGQNMLWEWRPPIFERSKTAAALVERRPHISIARVPDAFGHDLEHLLSKASAQSSETPEAASSLKAHVQRTLGRRGVGLASLLSLGGTHVAGALGFYLAFELFDRAPGNAVFRFVIPVDAADYFLRVLAGGSEHGQTYRRADLLVLELSESHLVISPVEIKSYGLKTAEGPGHGLPAPESAAFNDPLAQLTSSCRVLDDIERIAAELEEGADRALWFNALATLVETAIKLKPISDENSDELPTRLGRIARGEMKVTRGRPILTYFDYTGSGLAERDQFYVSEVGDSDLGAVGLIADTRAVFAALDQEESPLIDAWINLLEESKPRSEPSSSDQGASGETFHGEPVAGAEEAIGPVISDGTAPAPSGEVETFPNRLESEPERAGIRGDGVRIEIGFALDSIGKAPIDFWPGNTALTQMNVGIVGDLGTGKTEFVKALLAQIRSQAAECQPDESTSVLIFDYKGDFQGEEFLARVGGTVLEPYKMPLNVFMTATNEYARRPHQQAAAFVDTLSKIYSGIGPVQSSALKRVIRDIFEERQGEEPTLAEVLDRYLEDQGKPDSVSAILETFVYGEIFEYDRRGLTSFGKILEGRVLVVALDKLGQDQDAKNAVVALFLNLYYDHMIRSQKPPFQGLHPQLRYLKSFLVVDEAINIMRYNFSVLMDLMLQGRQFGFGVMLSSQYLSHFDTGKVNYGEPLRTWIIHRVPNVTVRQLGTLGLKGVPEKTADRVPSLDKHQALYQSFGLPEPRLVRVTPYYELFGL